MIVLLRRFFQIKFFPTYYHAYLWFWEFFYDIDINPNYIFSQISIIIRNLWFLYLFYGYCIISQ